MRLSQFIRENPAPIIAEWEAFAGTLVPSPETASPLSLRNHISYILAFIADDIESPQTGRSDDYRILRRLMPRVLSSPLSSSDIRTAVLLDTDPDHRWDLPRKRWWFSW